MKLSNKQLKVIINNVVSEFPECHFYNDFYDGEKTVLKRDDFIEFILKSKELNQIIQENIKGFILGEQVDIKYDLRELIWKKSFLQSYPDYKNIVKAIKKASKENELAHESVYRRNAAVSYIPLLKKLGYRVDKPAVKK